MLNRILICLFIILTMNGCQSTQFPTSTTTLPAGTTSAARLERQALGLRNVNQRDALLLNAAEAYLQEEQPEQTIRLLESLGERQQGKAAQVRMARLEARAWLQLEQLEKARGALAFVSRLQGADLLLLGEICAGLQDHRCAADAYIQAAIELGMGAADLPADMHDRIWFEMSRTNRPPQAFTHRYHQAWWALRDRLRSAGSVSSRITQWRQWQRENPSHPARINPPAQLRGLADYQVPKIGVLLPLSGALANAGNAVRDGVIAATLKDDGGRLAEVRFYDTAASGVGSAYERATASNVDVIVGPLLKPNAQAFAEMTAYSSTPRLLLNYLDSDFNSDFKSDFNSDRDTGLDTDADPAISPLFQFGIAIEDEVVSLADFMLSQGHSKVAVLYSQESWSQRARMAYTAQWPHAAIQAGFADVKNVTAAVGEAMQVSASEARRTEIANLLGQLLEFEPRARSDLDAFVALTSNIEAQALVPAMRYHFADDLPVYATSQAARGNKLKPLQGFRITEIPMLSDKDNPGHDLVTPFSLTGGSLSELYALGFDAYALASWLPLLRRDSALQIRGASGDLYLTGDGRFHRLLPVSEVTVQGGMRPVQ